MSKERKTAQSKKSRVAQEGPTVKPKKTDGSKLVPHLAPRSYADLIWPDERDVMLRPDRVKYVRKLVKPKGCVFCLASEEGPSFESLCLYRGHKAMVVMNKYPYNTGHLLVIPTRHTGELPSLKRKEHLELHALLTETVRILTEAYQPGGLNVGLNHGAAAGAGIPDHLHYHVIPRWWGDTNFFPVVAGTKVVVETLEQSWTRLLPYFEALDLKSNPDNGL